MHESRMHSNAGRNQFSLTHRFQQRKKIKASVKKTCCSNNFSCRILHL